MSSLDRFCAVAVMAKAPLVGAVKTRLVPPLSEAEAAELSGCFIRDIADNIVAAGRSTPIRGHIAYSPSGSEAAFHDLLPSSFRLLPPRRDGLGFSLADAAEDLLAAGYGSVCLVNADSPTLPTSILVETAQRLQPPGDRVVVGPAEDGGYYCIGLKDRHLRLFEDIDWSTERVFGQTLERAYEIGLDAVVLPNWYDVDDLASLRRLAGALFGESADQGQHSQFAAPHTAAFLRDLIGNGASRRLGFASTTADNVSARL